MSMLVTWFLPLSFLSRFSYYKTEVRELNNQVSEQEASITQLSEELAQTTSALQTSAATINLGKSYDEVQQRQKAILNYINCITVMTL